MQEEIASVTIMNSEQLLHSLRYFNKTHCNAFSIGVFAANQLPSIYKKPAAFIANTDDQGKPGTHWVAFYIPQSGRIEFFDSYGLPPLVNGHLSFLNGRLWSHNRRELQSLTSDVCGHYCLMFLACRMNGHPLKSFQTLFTRDFAANDRQVETCSNKILKHLRLANCAHSGGQYCCAKI
jgi:hypothetical protein